MPAPQDASILVIDDERSICVSCEKILKEEGFPADYTMSGTEGVKKAIEGNYDIVLLDLKMPDISGMEALERIRSARPDVTIIIITGYATIQTSIEAIKRGAFDYIPKPFTPEELALAITKAIEDRSLRQENEYLKKQLLDRDRVFSSIRYRSEAMRDVMNRVLKIAPTDFTLMIYGESGTGKELVAQAVHRNSLRKDRPLVAADISAIPATLLESELFGYMRGAFTGAVANKPGYFAMADGSTLFLDEISNTSWEFQGALLRALESKKIRPVGSNREQEVDIRLISATNQDLSQLVEAGRFREDLYYRLNVIPITVPPLRERTEDIPLLAMHFLEASKEKSASRITGFSTEAMAKMIAYRWPGNVRELKNVVECLAGTVDAELVLVEHLPETITHFSPLVKELGFEDTLENVEDLKVAKRLVRDKAYKQLESTLLLNALQKTGWNVSRAAELVGIQRPNFHALMRKHGIRKGED